MKFPKMKTPKPSKRALIILSILLTMFLTFAIPVTILYAKAMDDMIPSDQSTTLYNKYSPSHYSFQTVTPDRHFWQVSSKASDNINSIFDHVLSMAFLVGVQITRFFNFVAREAFEFSFMDSLISGIEDIIKNLTGVSGGDIGNGLWGSMFGIFASITLCYVLWQVVRFRFLDSLGTMASFVLALVVAFAFISNAGSFLRLMNTAGNELAATMYKGLAAPGGLNSSTTTGVQQISEQVWMELVMKPYGMLQFDDASAYEKHPDLVDKVLTTDPYSDERDKALKDVKGTWPAVEKVRADEQMIVLLCNGIFSLIILGLFCFWAISTIYFRIKLLIHATVMAVTLLASLLPGREAGLSVIRSQFLKLMGLVLMTTFAMFFLDLSLVVGHMTFDIVYSKAKAGWFTAMALETIVVFVVFKYREEIGSVFSKAAGHVPMTPRMKSTLLDETQRWGTRKLMSKASETLGGVFNRKEPEGVPNTFNPSALSRAGDNLNDATTASMQLRYQREKEASEQIAAETNKPVQYTPFVTKVNQNMQDGVKNPFRGMDKDWKEEKGRLGAIQKDGGDIRQAILTTGVSHDMNDQQVAATMYMNENAIRQASSLMVNRPKAAVSQLQRAGILNKNRKLEASVNDFIMVELFERYKIEHKSAFDTAMATGQPVNHTDFVKSMDERFRAAGLNTTQKVNTTMLSRSGRISIASKFESMPAYTKKRQDLLSANDALRKPSGSPEAFSPSVPPISLPAPISPASVMKGMPKLPNNSRQSAETPNFLFGKPHVKMSIDFSKVKIPDIIKQNMEVAKEKVNSRVEGLQPGEQLRIDSVAKTSVVVNLKNKLTTEVSEGLDGLNNELKIMQRANGRKLTEAQTTTDTENIVKKTSKTAQQTRKPNSRPSIQ